MSLDRLATLRGDFGELPEKSATLRGRFGKAGAQVPRGLTLISGSGGLGDKCSPTWRGGEGARLPIKSSEL